MKEIYFTPDNIDDEAKRMIAELGAFPGRGRRLPSPGAVMSPPGRAALLVLDMQDTFLDEGSHAFVPSAPAIIPRVRALVDAFLAKKLPVIYTRHLNTEDDAGMMSRWWSGLITADDPMSEISRELHAEGVGIVTKTQYDAFHGTGLETKLSAGGRKIERLVLSGVMTHLCVETTARSAFMRGFEPFVPVDEGASHGIAEEHGARLRRPPSRIGDTGGGGSPGNFRRARSFREGGRPEDAPGGSGWLVTPR
ncbi:MAG: cysteine hydrolase [Candidatus Krumholzibacteria bacterium]|nr:cysteine hydrolase [Candidatus Krumholzibacteria bacterium]